MQMVEARVALERGDGLPVELFDGDVRFEMLDGQKIVRCRVTRGALDDRALLDGNTVFRSGELFVTYRLMIEAAADKLHAAGAGSPVIERF